MNGAKYFTTLDLRPGFYQIRMAEGSKEKTAFVCPFGLYQYTRMAMGLCNSPATFQRVVNRLLKGLDREFGAGKVFGYIDDLLVATKSLDEHLQVLHRLFERLREFGLKLHPKKCHFFRRTVPYLGYIFRRQGRLRS